MAYRGGDLDLRTPRTWSATAPEPPASPVYEQRVRGTYAPGPIWVDEVVLACVNHAYDVALAHRATDVRLEHLLHALTRIDTAAEALEIRGIRVSALRRESATAIASELPVGLSGGEAGPRHSEELEHVLRAASQIASRRNAPATVDDLLHLMLDVEPDLPGLGLLARIDHRFGPSNGAYGRPVRSGYNARFITAQPETHPSPPPPFQREATRPSRPDFTSATVDNAQHSRLEVLEQMMRGLSADLGSERKSLSNLLGDLQRDVAELHAAPGEIGPVADRIAAIERSITAGFEQFTLALASIENDLRTRSQQALDTAPIASRLEMIEEAVLSKDGDRLLAGLLERFDRLETTLAGERTRTSETGAALRGEIGQLAQSVGAHRAEIANAVLPVADRIAEFRSSVESGQAESGQTLRALGDRMATVERLVADTLQKVIEGQSAARDDLTEVSDAIVKLNANQHTLSANIEQSRNDTRDGLSALRDDVKVTSASLTANMDALSPRFAVLEGEAQRIGGAVEGLHGTMENMHRVTVERYYRRNRFWYWLFGTDDWVAASWPSQSHRIAEELKSIKSGRR